MNITMNDPIANPQHRSNITLFVEGILKPISSSVTNDEEDVEEEHKMYVAHSVPNAADIRSVLPMTIHRFGVVHPL